jgi:hypothetical protein
MGVFLWNRRRKYSAGSGWEVLVLAERDQARPLFVARRTSGRNEVAGSIPTYRQWSGHCPRIGVAGARQAPGLSGAKRAYQPT